MADVTVEQVDAVLGSHSMASVRSWLGMHDVQLSPSTPRAKFAKAVHDKIVEKNIGLDALNEGMIDIEEAGGKRISLFKIDVGEVQNASIRKQLLSIVGGFSKKRVPAPLLPDTTRRVYVTETERAIRVKWSETHTSYRTDIETLRLVPDPETVLVVLVLDKETGLVQIRYDRPGTTHPHGRGAAAFYRHFKEEAETLLGPTLPPQELRPALSRVVNLKPRIVESRSLELSTEDNFTFKVIPKTRGKDVRDSRDVAAMASHGTEVKVREVEDLTWFPEQSEARISRQIKTHVDGREGYVRFEADYHEGEVTYVLERLV